MKPLKHDYLDEIRQNKLEDSFDMSTALHGSSRASRHHFSFVSLFEIQKFQVKGIVSFWGHIEHIADMVLQKCRNVGKSLCPHQEFYGVIWQLPCSPFFDTVEIIIVRNSVQGFVVGD